MFTSALRNRAATKYSASECGGRHSAIHSGSTLSGPQTSAGPCVCLYYSHCIMKIYYILHIHASVFVNIFHVFLQANGFVTRFEIVLMYVCMCTLNKHLMRVCVECNLRPWISYRSLLQNICTVMVNESPLMRAPVMSMFVLLAFIKTLTGMCCCSISTYDDETLLTF